MSYRITVNNPNSAWQEKSDGTVRQALRRQAELCAGIADSPIFRRNYGDQVADGLVQAAMRVREGEFSSLHELVVAAGRYTRVSGFTGAIACLIHYVNRMKAAIQTGEESF